MVVSNVEGRYALGASREIYGSDRRKTDKNDVTVRNCRENAQMKKQEENVECKRALFIGKPNDDKGSVD